MLATYHQKSHDEPKETNDTSKDFNDQHFDEKLSVLSISQSGTASSDTDSHTAQEVAKSCC
jgi:hypothetical protein